MFSDLSEEQVSRIVRESMGNSPLPILTDDKVRGQAKQIAEEQGIFERIDETLTPEAPIPVLPYSRYRDYIRNGNRIRYEKLAVWRGQQIELAAMACWLGVDRFEYLQNLIWAECESTWWVWPAHEATKIDLFSAIKACQLAGVLRMFERELEDEVRDRVKREIHRRVLDTYTEPNVELIWWRRGDQNWNAVCHGAVGITAMLIEDDADRLTADVLELLKGLPYYLADAFTADGGSSEGAGYWRFGFGWYVRLAAALHDFTGGRIDLMDHERIDGICRYPLAAVLTPGQDIAFADAHGKYMPLDTAVLINRFRDVPELFSLCELRDDGTAKVSRLSDLLVYDGRKIPPLEDRRDYFLPDLGMVKLRCGAVTVAIKAGHNAEHHNHNDIGSFIIHRGRTCFLTDLGAPIYSKKTFSPRRYESIFCNSFGHSVPVVNGQLQSAGKEFRGTLEVVGLNESGTRTASIEMAKAYPAGAGLERLTRTIELPADGAEVTLTDEFVFVGEPASLAEAFITTCPAEIVEDGAAVRISSESDGVAELRSIDTEGRFAITELKEESEAEAKTGELIRRITFVPTKLSPQMTLRFVMGLR